MFSRQIEQNFIPFHELVKTKIKGKMFITVPLSTYNLVAIYLITVFQLLIFMIYSLQTLKGIKLSMQVFVLVLQFYRTDLSNSSVFRKLQNHIFCARLSGHS